MAESVTVAEKKSTFCVLPWIHLATHPGGNVTLCCEANAREGYARDFAADGSPLPRNLNHHSIQAIYNSDYFRSVRLEMLAGKAPQACGNCFFKEAQGAESKREFENRKYAFREADARRATAPDGSVRPNFRCVELRLGTLCNVKCRSCGAYSSSK